TTPLLRPVWCWARAGSFSSTVTSSPIPATRWARATPTMPPPTIPTRRAPMPGTSTGRRSACPRPAFQLPLDPGVGAGEPVLQADLWLPAEDRAHQGEVGVGAADALGLGQVVTLLDGLAGGLGHHVYQLVHGDHAVLAEVDRLMMVGLHDPVDALH